MPSELAFDLVNKGELATVEKPTYVKGSKRAEASEQTQEYWVAPVQAAIRQAGAPTWVEIKLSRASGGGLVPFGIVSPAADLNTLLGSQGGSAAMLSSGDFWCNGQLRQRGYSKIDRGNVVRIEVKDKKSLWINGVEAWKHEGGFDGWRFAVGGYAEQHAFEIVDFGSE